MLKPTIQTYFLASLFSLFGFTTMLQAQELSFGINLGYAQTQGDPFNNPSNSTNVFSLGIGYDLDLLYVFENVEGLMLGVSYNRNIFFTASDESVSYLGFYGLALYGAKLHYTLLDDKKLLSPFASLTLGLGQFSTPPLSYYEPLIDNIQIVVPPGIAFNFGIRPELGIQINRVTLSVSYIVPMNYNIEWFIQDFEAKVGSLNICAGYRHNFKL